MRLCFESESNASILCPTNAGFKRRAPRTRQLGRRDRATWALAGVRHFVRKILPGAPSIPRGFPVQTVNPILPEDGGCEQHGAAVAKAALGSRPRAARVRQALRLQYLTISWNVVEGAVALLAAGAVGSVALIGFGLDSFVECCSSVTVIWRLVSERAERLDHDGQQRVERRARRLVACSLFILAVYTAFAALRSLWIGGAPGFSAVGVVLTSLSLAVMLWVAKVKRGLARELGSQALEADAFQTTACWWLSLAALCGLGLNGLLGWWWADPLAALAIAGLIAREARSAWRGKSCC
jgi:hypothetical protein